MSDQPTSEDWLHKTLRLSGISYLIGDTAMFVGGMLAASKLAEPSARKGEQLKAATGLLWGIGGLATARYGNPDTEKQLEILAHKLERYLVAHGARVSDGIRTTTDLLPAHDHFWATTERFLYEHPSEVLNAVYAVGAGTMLAGGVIKGDTNKKMIGGLVMAGALGGLLIKEDQNAGKNAAHGNLIDKATAYVQEKPLRFSSVMYGLNNVFLIKDAMASYSKHRHATYPMGFKPHHFSFLCAASYIVGNIALFMSQRNQIEDKRFSESDIARLEQVAAEIIGAQPKEVRELMLQHVTDFLAKEKSIPLSPEHLAKTLEARVEKVEERRVNEVAERGWRNRHEALKRAQENKQVELTK